jgi:hypothetical protein
MAHAHWQLADLLLLQVTKESALGLDKNKRNFDIREEYFVSIPQPQPLFPGSG